MPQPLSLGISIPLPTLVPAIHGFVSHFLSSTASSTSTAPTVTIDPYFGFAYDYTSASYLDIDRHIVSIPEGSSIIVSTIMSIYTTETAAWASASAAARSGSSQYTILRLRLSICRSCSHLAYLDPHWRTKYNFDTVDNDLRGSSMPHVSCAGYSEYQAGSVGLHNTTFWAGFSTSTGCTSWDTA